MIARAPARLPLLSHHAVSLSHRHAPPSARPFSGKLVSHVRVAVLPCSKSVDSKFAKHLARAVPLCIRHLHRAPEGEDELREHCLQVCGCVGGGGGLMG